MISNATLAKLKSAAAAIAAGSEKHGLGALNSVISEEETRAKNAIQKRMKAIAELRAARKKHRE